jgi:non-ribosomal peptide synthetase component F
VGSINAYLDDALQRLQPRTLRELIETLNPDTAARVKAFLTQSLLTILARDDTAKTINGILSAQIEQFLITPIGRLADHMPAGAIEKASVALTEKIVAAARERLPAAIA